MSTAGPDHWWILLPFVWLFWLGVVALVLLPVLRERRGCRRAYRSATDILAERFARGDLSVEEFRERLDLLR